MADFNKKQQYQRWIKPAQPSQLYPFAYNFVLVKSLEELKEILSRPFDIVAFDTETTGLNLDDSFLVGYSFCYDGKTAYYVPVDHEEYFIAQNQIEITKEEFDKAKEFNLDTREIKYEFENAKFYKKSGYTVKPGLGELAVLMFYLKMKACKWVYMFNARFDMRVFEKYGFVQNNIPMNKRYETLFNTLEVNGKKYPLDMSQIHFLDVQVLVFLSDTNVPYPSLKKSEEYFLGWRGASFEETLGTAASFYHLKPEEAYVYAATDALGTFLLAGVLMQFYEEAKYSGYLDNAFLYPLMLMEEELIGIDINLLKKYSKYYQTELDKIHAETIKILGEPINLGSPKQKSVALTSLGIKTYDTDNNGKLIESVNKRGEVKADKKHLQDAQARYDKDSPEYRLINCMLQYATLTKQKGTYTDNFVKMCDDKKAKYGEEYGDRLRFSYKTMVVPSGRLAAGGDKKNSYFADSNIQNITKPKIGDAYYIHVDQLKDLGIDISNYDNPREEYECLFEGSEKPEHTYKILDWVFKETPWPIEYSEDKPNHFVIEGFKQKLNTRSAFVPDDGMLWVSCDYSAQELRVPALISREPLWTKTFAEGGDLHKAMAIQMWGAENYSKQKRKMAKKINFGILYGMTARNFAEEFDCSMEEANALIKKYKESAPILFDWVHRNEQQFIQTGTGHTLYGRPRRLGWYLSQQDRGLYNFGIRSCTNTVIQGTGADILKMGFLNIFEKFFKDPTLRATNRKHIKFLNTVHDEINYGVDKRLVYKVVPAILSCMRLWQDDWAFPMQVGLDIGNRWGQTVAFNYDGRPYVNISEQPAEPGEQLYKYISYDEMSFEEGCAKNIIGKTRYIPDPNGDYVVNKKYLSIIGPAGDPYNPKDFKVEEQVIEEIPVIEEETEDLAEFLENSFEEE